MALTEAATPIAPARPLFFDAGTLPTSQRLLVGGLFGGFLFTFGGVFPLCRGMFTSLPLSPRCAWDTTPVPSQSTTGASAGKTTPVALEVGMAAVDSPRRDVSCPFFAQLSFDVASRRLERLDVVRFLGDHEAEPVAQPGLDFHRSWAHPAGRPRRASQLGGRAVDP